MTQMTATTTKKLRILPWGEEIYLEIPLFKKSLNKFYARHGKTSEGKHYIEFSKFGPKPNTEGESYSQKLRLYDPVHWVMIKHQVEEQLADSIGWDLTQAELDLADSIVSEAEVEAKK